MGALEEAARKRRKEREAREGLGPSTEAKEQAAARRAFREKTQPNIGFGYDPSRGGITALATPATPANPPVPTQPVVQAQPTYAPWRSPELKEAYEKSEADRKAWSQMQEQQGWATAPVSQDMPAFVFPEDPSSKQQTIAPYEDPSRSSGGYSGGAVSGYSMRNQRPQYAKWLDTYTVEAAANARDKNELEQISLAQQAREADVAEWNRQQAEEQQQILDGVNKEMGMLREELGMASQMYREQLANTGGSYNPGGIASALLAIGNAFFGGGPERGVALLDSLAKKDLENQKLLLRNSKRAEDSLLGRYQQITGDKDKAEQLYLAFVKDQQAAEARVLANKVANVEVRNRLNQKTAELVREREKIEYGIEESLYRERQAAAQARAAAIQQQRLAQRSGALRADGLAQLEKAFGMQSGPSRDIIAQAGITREQQDKAKAGRTYTAATQNLKSTKTVMDETGKILRIFNKYKGDDVPGVGFFTGRIDVNDVTNTLAFRSPEEAQDAKAVRESLAVISNNLSTSMSKGNPSESENARLAPIFKDPTMGAATLKGGIERARQLMQEEVRYVASNLPETERIIYMAENADMFGLAPSLDEEISK